MLLSSLILSVILLLWFRWILPEIGLMFLGVALVVGGIATILAISISKIFARYIVKINYQNIVFSIITFITLLTFFFDGFIGLTILATATAIGLVASYWGIGKNHLMGCLIVPVILFFVL